MAEQPAAPAGGDEPSEAELLQEVWRIENAHESAQRLEGIRALLLLPLDDGAKVDLIVLRVLSWVRLRGQPPTP